MTRHGTLLVTASLGMLLGVFRPAIVARADIFQWEYINPANPGQGKQQSETLAPDGAGVNAAPGGNLSNRDLTKGYLVALDLSNSNFRNANLTDAIVWGDLAGAELTGAEVRGAHLTEISIDQLYTTGSYQARDLTGIILGYLDLTGINLFGQNLTDANFANAAMAGANLSHANAAHGILHRVNLANANLSHANFADASFATFFASFSGADLTDADLSHANLANAGFQGFTKVGFEGGVEYYPGASLNSANLSGADARGANFFLANLADATTTNLIQANGHIAGLDLSAGASLVVRDYDGNASVAPPTGPLPITIDGHLAMSGVGALKLQFDADGWDSTISFAAGIPVARDGTLELAFAPDVDVASQLGRTIDLFDWTGVTPTGAFTVSSPYSWDLSKLYTTGEVTLTAVPGLAPADFNGDGSINGADLTNWKAGFGAAGVATHIQGDADGDLDVDGSDFLVWQRQLGSGVASAAVSAVVPEPTTAMLLLLTAAGALAVCRGGARTPGGVINSLDTGTPLKRPFVDTVGACREPIPFLALRRPTIRAHLEALSNERFTILVS